MPQWEYYSEDWEVWNETLPSGKHMSAYRHPDGYVWPANITAMPGGWINVKPYADCRFGDELEKNMLPPECSWLEIECVMHEMRAKYGGA